MTILTHTEVPIDGSSNRKLNACTLDLLELSVWGLNINSQHRKYENQQT
jgi:hypothetical protein